MHRAVAKAYKVDWDGVVADTTEALRLNPEYMQAYMNRGSARNQLGDERGGALDFEQALRLNPRLPQAKQMRAFIQRKLSRPSKY